MYLFFLFIDLFICLFIYIYLVICSFIHNSLIYLSNKPLMDRNGQQSEEQVNDEAWQKQTTTEELMPWSMEWGEVLHRYWYLEIVTAAIWLVDLKIVYTMNVMWYIFA